MYAIIKTTKLNIKTFKNMIKLFQLSGFKSLTKPNNGYQDIPTSRATQQQIKRLSKYHKQDR